MGRGEQRAGVVRGEKGEGSFGVTAGEQDLAVLLQRGHGLVHLPLLVGQLGAQFVVFTGESVSVRPPK